jgi:hypothetical protein
VRVFEVDDEGVVVEDVSYQFAIGDIFQVDTSVRRYIGTCENAVADGEVDSSIADVYAVTSVTTAVYVKSIDDIRILR